MVKGKGEKEADGRDKEKYDKEERVERKGICWKM